MKLIVHLSSVLMTLALLVLIASCTSAGPVTPQTQGSSLAPSAGSTSQPLAQDSQRRPFEALQQTDETVLVQLGRTYSHSFPAGFYLEYALNNPGEKALTITLVPSGSQNMALTIVRSDDRRVTVLDLDEGGASETEHTRFVPEAGVNYLLWVYEVSGDEGRYALTIAP